MSDGGFPLDEMNDDFAQNGHEIISPRIYIQFYMNNFEKTNMALVTGILLKKKAILLLHVTQKTLQ